jgi:hypothetical protein
VPRRITGGASTTPVNGVYTLAVRIPRCAYGPGSLAMELYAQDNTFRVTTARIHGPVIVSSDHIAPAVQLRRGSASRAYVATFSEPVHGISGKGVVASTTRDPADRVSGTWTCFRRTSGPVHADCRTGQVSRARFVVNGPAELRSVDFEPNHHLDVLDDNGNPLTHDGLARVH